MEEGEINHLMQVKTAKFSVIANYCEVIIVDFDCALFSTPSVCVSSTIFQIAFTFHLFHCQHKNDLFIFYLVLF